MPPTASRRRACRGSSVLMRISKTPTARCGRAFPSRCRPAGTSCSTHPSGTRRRRSCKSPTSRATWSSPRRRRWSGRTTSARAGRSRTPWLLSRAARVLAGRAPMARSRWTPQTRCGRIALRTARTAVRRSSPSAQEARPPSCPPPARIPRRARTASISGGTRRSAATRSTGPCSTPTGPGIARRIPSTRGAYFGIGTRARSRIG